MTPEERIEQLEYALQRIRDWAEAYPLDVFPEPDWQETRRLLEAGGTSLDRVSAGVMRRAVAGMGRIAQEALADRALARD